MSPEIQELYNDHFKSRPQYVCRAPGRVNLIGEHTDYNEGFVLPLAVDKGVRIAGSARADKKLVLHSAAYGETVEVPLDSLAFNPQRRWANYVLGVADRLQKRGLTLAGCDAVIDGDLPQGAGLSSSAALEVATAVFLSKSSGFILPDLDLVKTCQEAENQFVGVSCGIMDQFASFLCRKSQALLIDCRSLETQSVPLGDGLSVVVCNTGVERTLAGSAYNQRRKECEEAVGVLSSKIPGIQSLRDVSPVALENYQSLLSPVVFKRARHVVSENKRVGELVSALGRGDRTTAGKLLAASHDSLKNDYEVSCPELDVMVDIARGCPGVVGGRMTGAGFGGCTVNLVVKGAEEDFSERVRSQYGRATGRIAQVYVFQAADGAKYANL